MVQVITNTALVIEVLIHSLVEKKQVKSSKIKRLGLYSYTQISFLLRQTSKLLYGHYFLYSTCFSSVLLIIIFSKHSLSGLYNQNSYKRIFELYNLNHVENPENGFVLDNKSLCWPSYDPHYHRSSQKLQTCLRMRSEELMKMLKDERLLKKMFLDCNYKQKKCV